MDAGELVVGGANSNAVEKKVGLDALTEIHDPLRHPGDVRRQSASKQVHVLDLILVDQYGAQILAEHDFHVVRHAKLVDVANDGLDAIAAWVRQLW